MSNKKYLILLFLSVQCFLLQARDYPAAQFNIHGDGTTLNTRSIQFAIDHISKNGGGRLVFAVGRFLTGTVYLKSNVDLHLGEGAVLVGSLNPFDYQRNNWTALIFAIGQHDIAITGKGMIDGQGKQVARNFITIIEKGLLKDPLRYGRPEAEARPMNIYMRQCRNIQITEITLRNSASWNQTYDQCKNLSIDHIVVDNKDFWNEDGIDIVDCDSASVTNSFIDAADDGVCLKSHDPKLFCNNINIYNNRIRTSANGIKFGTASLGGFRNIRMVKNTVYDTYRSAIALEAVDGGFVENILVDSLQVYNTGNVVFLRLGERWGEKTSRMSNITVSNVYAEIPAGKPDAGYGYEGPIEDLPRNISPAIIIAGLSNKKISNVSFQNIEIRHPGGADSLFANVPLDRLNSIPELPAQYPDFSMFKELPAWAIFVRHATGIMFSDVKLSVAKKDFRVPVVFDDVQASQCKSFAIKGSSFANPFYLSRSKGVGLDKTVKPLADR